MDRTIYHNLKLIRLYRGPHLLQAPPDIPIGLYNFDTPYLLYYTESAFGLYFREQKIKFGHVSEAETKERWHNVASDRKKYYQELRRSIKRYRVAWRNFLMQECGKSDKFVNTKLKIIKKADEEYIKIKQDHARELARKNSLPEPVKEQITHLVRVKQEEYHCKKIQHPNILKRKRNEV